MKIAIKSWMYKINVLLKPLSQNYKIEAIFENALTCQ